MSAPRPLACLADFIAHLRPPRDVVPTVCPTGKTTYASEIAAKLALDGIRDKRARPGGAPPSPGPGPRDTYYCNKCGAWHLTKWVAPVLVAVLLLLGCATAPLRAPVVDQVTRTIYADPVAVDRLCADRLNYWTWYLACYDARADVVILPHDPPRWLREHEELHRQGWSHDHGRRR